MSTASVPDLRFSARMGAALVASPNPWLADFLSQAPLDVLRREFWQHLTPHCRRNILHVSSHIRSLVKDLLVIRLKAHLPLQLLASPAVSHMLSGYARLCVLDIQLQETEVDRLSNEPELLGAALACINATNGLQALSVRVQYKIRKLRTYEWYDGPILTAPLLGAVLGHCSALRKLDLFGFKGIEDSALAPLALSTQLTSLSLVFNHINDGLQIEVLESMPLLPELASLSLGFLKHDAHYVYLAAKVPNLTNLHVTSKPRSNSDWEDGIVLMPLLGGMAGLQALTLYTYEGDITRAVRGLTNLRRLIAPRADVKYMHLVEGNLRLVQELCLNRFTWRGDAAEQLPPVVLPRVTSLCVHPFLQAEDRLVLLHPSFFANLQRLFLDMWVDEVHLTHWDLSAVKQVTAAVPHIFVQVNGICTPGCLALLSNWGNLAGVLLSCCPPLTQATAAFIAAIPEWSQHMSVVGLKDSLMRDFNTAQQLLELCDSLPWVDNLILDLKSHRYVVQPSFPSDKLLSQLVALWTQPGRASRASPLTISMQDGLWTVDEIEALNEQLREAGCIDLRVDSEGVFAAMGFF